jgi:hypothetical protein
LDNKINISLGELMSKKKICIVCEKDSDMIPLIKFKFKGEKYSICSEHLPILIHKPQELAEKLPQAEDLPAGNHDH